MSHEPVLALKELLVRRFDRNELRKFVAAFPDGERLIQELPFREDSDREVIERVTDGLVRRGLINNDFFERLRLERPRCGDVDALSEQFGFRPRTGQRPRQRFLPLKGSHFVPRPRLEEHVLRALGAGDRTCVSIHGFDGLGKSTLLLQLAYKVQSVLGEQGRLLYYALERHGGLSLAQIHGDLELSRGRPPRADMDRADLDSWEVALLEALAGFDEVWLFIDDIHHMTAEGAANADLEALMMAIPARLASGTRLRIVATSAETPTGCVAHGMPRTQLPLEPMSPEEAVDLLDKLAVVGDRTVIRDLAQRAEWIPSRMLQIAEYVRQKGSAAKALQDLHEFRDPQRDLVDQGYRALSSPAQKVLDALTVFSGPVDVGVLSAALEQPSAPTFREALDELERRHFITGSKADERTYTIPTYLCTLLSKRLGADEQRRLHRRAAEALKGGPGPADWRVTVDASCTLARLDHLLRAEDWHAGMQLFREIEGEGLARLGLHARRVQFAKRLAEVLDDPAEASLCLRASATACLRLGCYEEAIDRAEQAERRARVAEDWEQVFFCLNAHGIIAFTQRAMEAASGHYKQALELCEQQGLNPYHRVVGMANVAETLCYMGDFGGAKELTDEVFTAFERGIRPWKHSALKLLVSTWIYRAQIHLAWANHPSARYCIDVAIALARGSDNHWHLGAGLDIHGEIILADPTTADRLDEAVAAYTQAIALLNQTGRRTREGVARFHLGRAYHRHGRLDDARREYEAAIAINEEARGEAVVYQGVLALAAGLEALARQKFRDGADACQCVLDRRCARLYEVRYALALARLGEALLLPDGAGGQSVGAAEAARIAYDKALAVSDAPGVCAAALQALDLVPSARGGHPLIAEVRARLAGERVRGARAAP